MSDLSRRRLLQLAGTGLSASLLAPVASLAEPAGGSEPVAPAASVPSAPYELAPLTYFAHRLGTDHAEGIAVIDMNGDGRPDITSGAYWYENPGPAGGPWKRHKFRELAPILPSAPPGAPTTKVLGGSFWDEFVADNGEFAIDVNKNGRLDLVTSSWQDDGIWWFENPGRPGEMWKPHFICHSVDTEGFAMGDIDGDGHDELIAAHFGRQGLIWINFAGTEPVVHQLGARIDDGKHGQGDGHGVGVADVDGDGKLDVLTPFGWFKNIDAAHDQWEWHPEWELGDTGFPILGLDVNNDGRMDLIYGHGHNFGLYWLEQTVENGRRSWRRHVIDNSFSQVHALKLADLDGDGELELLAGKRYRGHNGHDPGSYMPLCIYYYKIERGPQPVFTRHTISYNGTAAAGTQFVVTDIDGDGDLDILVAGKTGVHWLESLKVDEVPRDAREKELLYNYDWPFPGEGTGLGIEKP